MKKEKSVIRIPTYSLHEELMNAISHGVGALFAIGALVLCVVKSAVHADPWAVVSSAVYGATLVLMFTLSTIYHALKINKAKRVFRVLDHCGVFLVVAGSYTPYTLVSLRGPLGWTIFGIIWGFTIVGIVFNAINVDRYSIVSAIINLVTGWGILLAVVPLARVLPPLGLSLLFTGGFCYTIGAVLYALGAKKKFFHSIFHVFVLIGAILHFFSIFLYVI
ncbi:MAG: hemolysin III family protein [Clostridiales bacterium]|nr:hemolysin III family protein [Clostridiales bacterium]